VLQFSGEWGFTMCWAGKNIAPYEGKAWYPDFDAVMSIAKNVNSGTNDLFPQYGMASL
jgi:hypothetical protein